VRYSLQGITRILPRYSKRLERWSINQTLRWAGNTKSLPEDTDGETLFIHPCPPLDLDLAADALKGVLVYKCAKYPS
jgi:hypothetical protein